MKGQEQACEHIGSLAHSLWSPDQSLSPAPWADRLQLLQTRVLCLGHPRDEMIVQQTASLMEQIGRNPSHAARSEEIKQVARAKESAGGRHSADTLSSFAQESSSSFAFRGPRDVGEARKLHREAGLPSKLPEGLQTMISGKVRGNTVSELPAQWQVSKRAKKAAPSTVAEGLQQWLNSIEGREWREHRDAVFKS